MELNAATRLRASSSLVAANEVQRLRKYAESMDAKQLQFLVYGLPKLVQAWLGGRMNGAIQAKLPKLALASPVAASYERLILGLTQLRPLFKPEAVGMIQRVTALPPALLKSQVIDFDPQKFKQLTSWTSKRTLPSTIAAPNSRHGSTVILKTTLKGTKHVLATGNSCYRYVRLLLSDVEWYMDRLEALNAKTPQEMKSIRQQLPAALKTLTQMIKTYAVDEGEVLVFLNKGETLPCTWKLIED